MVITFDCEVLLTAIQVLALYLGIRHEENLGVIRKASDGRENLSVARVANENCYCWGARSRDRASVHEGPISAGQT